MRILLWIGNEPNQIALAHKIHLQFGVSAVVTETRRSRIKLSFRKVLFKVAEKILLGEIDEAWKNMLQYYKIKYPSHFSFPSLDVENINSDKTILFTKEFKPDIIVVSGTRLVKEDIINSFNELKIINLHTGLSPYIKGGPNCTNWCIATGQDHLIGNTVMWIDKGIDSGDIIASEFTSWTPNDSLNDLHMKVMEHAHVLVLKSIHHISSGGNNRVKQSTIDRGSVYYTKDWTLKRKFQLVNRLKKIHRSSIFGSIEERQKHIKVFPL